MNSVFGDARVQIPFVIHSVLTLLLSSTVSVGSLTPKANHAHLDGGSVSGANSTYLPYVISPSNFPTPSFLPNASGNATWSRVASSQVGAFSFYSLVYVQTDLVGNSSLVYSLGSFSPSLATSLARSASCRNNCPWNLPIAWSSPVTIAGFGNTSIQGTALVAVNSSVGVAVDEAGWTHVYLSPSLGTSGTWLDVTGATPVAGNSPNITLWPCQGVLLTTLTAAHLVATDFPMPCPSIASPPGTQRPLGGFSPPSPPFVSSVNPSTGSPNQVITISGGDFASGATVRFGAAASPAVTYISTTTLTAAAPAGSGVVDVIVTVNGQTSAIVPQDEFTYSGPAPPTVSSVSPTHGLPGTAVTILGTNFTAASTVQFGTVAASPVTVVSTQRLTMSAPANHGTVYVTVTTAGGTSAKTGSTLFSYDRPTIASISPALGYPTAILSIVGQNFSSGAAVTFGTTPALTVAVLSSTSIRAEIPWGLGTVYVRVTNPGGSQSATNAHCRFTWVTTAQLGNRSTQLLPPAYSAWPVYSPPSLGFNSTMGILASNISNNQVLFYHTSTVGAPFLVAPVAPFLPASGSPLFTTIGATRLETPGGFGGLVSAADIGPVVFGLFTTRSENRTVVETVTSGDYGYAWGQPYLASSIVGSLTEPAIATSPAGYVYATWADNGLGPWQVDTQQFDPSGRPLGNASALPGSQGVVGGGAQDPSVAVDGLHRPLYVWTALNSSADPQVVATGGFPNPTAATKILWASLNNTVAADYNPLATPSQISTYESNLGTNLSAVLGNLATYDLCSAHRNIVREVYSYVTWAIPTPILVTNTTCGQTKLVTPLIARAAGATSANFSLSVETQWVLESLGFGLFPTPAWVSLVPTGQTGTAVPYSTGGSTTDGTNSLVVGAVGVNPKTIELNASADFPGVSTTNRRAAGPNCLTSVYPPSGIPTTYSFTNTDAPVNYSTKVWINSSAAQTYLSNVTLLAIYVTNLSRSIGTWHENVTANYQQTFIEEKTCGRSSQVVQRTVVPIKSGWPVHPALQVQGSYSTYFGLTTPTVNVNVQSEPNGLDRVDVNWTTSLYGYGSTALKDLNNGSRSFSPSHATSASPVLNQDWLFDNVTAGRNLIAYANTTSEPGTTNWSWSPTLNTGQLTTNTSAAVLRASCIISTGPNPVHLYWSTSNNVTGVTGTAAVLAWWSNVSGVGWVRYQEAYGPSLMAGATEYSTGPNNFSYQVALKGLTPWGIYSATIGVTALASGSSCEHYTQTAQWSFRTLAKFQLYEQDLPYDSISHEGGGAVVTWELPLAFIIHAAFVSGVLSYFVVGNGSIVQIPISPLPGVYYCPNCYTMNLTALTLNATYNLTMALNFTYGGTSVNGTSFPFTFWYEKDTSGDGLTDWEKTRGWEVTYRDAGGSWSNRWVQANPLLFATNGVTSDYLEKEFGLDPRVLSTTNDGMLDAWNLTFDLGPGNATLPATGFQFWYENASYNFSRACPDPQMKAPCTFNPALTDANNLTATGRLNPGGDNGPWSAEQLWSGSGTGNALAQLQALIANEDQGARLRAITGTFPVGGVAHRTMTVWGKLSWGADPLAWSTSHYKSAGGTDVPDGALVNPLGYANLNVTIASWSMSGLSSGDGVATFIHASSAATSYFPNGRIDYSTYSLNSSSPGGGDSYPGSPPLPNPFIVNFPAESDEQYAAVNFSMVANNSGHGFLRDNSPAVSVDLENSSAHVLRFWGGNPAQNYTLNVTYQVSPVFSRANTILLVPGDNSTLTSLPLGLQRYSGEQDFILLELNDTIAGSGFTLTSAAAHYVNSTAANGISPGTYQAGLTDGLNNLLVPRALFKNSPLGEALLNLTFQNITTRGYQGGLNGTFEPGYWMARVTGTVFGGINYSFSSNPSQYIKVYSNTNQNCSGGSPACGGVSSNSAIESGTPSYAIGAIFALNISTVADLNDLLAGLVLNASGNFTNWGFAATPYLPTIGLSTTVTSAVANPVYFNSGGYSAPIFNPPAPSPTVWQKVGAVVWNAVSGVVGLVSAAWDWIAAAGSFLSYLGSIVAQLGLASLRQVASVLESVAGAIDYAVNALLSWIASTAKAFLSPAVAAASSSFSMAEASLQGYRNAAVNGAIWSFESTGGSGLPLSNVTANLA